MSTEPRTSTESSLRLVWLYPDLLSTYGDRGNLLILARRADLLQPVLGRVVETLGEGEIRETEARLHRRPTRLARQPQQRRHGRRRRHGRCGRR